MAMLQLDTVPTLPGMVPQKLQDYARKVALPAGRHLHATLSDVEVRDPVCIQVVAGSGLQVRELRAGRAALAAVLRTVVLVADSAAGSASP